MERGRAAVDDARPRRGALSERRRFLLAAFGDPGHVFPVIALGRELLRRGHEVWLQTWERWREDAEREGFHFSASPVYDVWPLDGLNLKPYQAAVRAARETEPLMEEVDPHAVVADIITIAASLAAQAAGKRWATLVPHVFPVQERGFPPYSIGARLPRTRAGALMWQAFDPLTRSGVELGREQLNGARGRLGLPPVEHLHGGLSRELTLVGTFPQLEYPRSSMPPWVRVTGPLLWERPYEDTEPPPGDDPLVLVAPSTAQDRDQRMLRAALEGLAGEPVRVLATTNRRSPPVPVHVPANAKLVDWVSYAKAMARCDAVVCHAGHGTLVRALASGLPVVACPAAGDMAENAARVTWAGAGVSLPRRLVTPRGVRLAVRRLLAEPAYARKASELAAWARAHDGAAAAASELERFAVDSRQTVGGGRPQVTP